MGGLDDYKPAMAMVGLQFIYAGLALFTRVALVRGMSPRVYVVYRQAIATLVMAPIACFARRYVRYNHINTLVTSTCSLSLSLQLISLSFCTCSHTLAAAGRRNPGRISLGLKSFSLIFVASLVGYCVHDSLQIRILLHGLKLNEDKVATLIIY